MLKKSALSFAVLVALAACGQQQASTPAPVAVESGPSRADAIERIARGDVFRVTLNACDDEGWTGEGDPMGTLKCGETYEVRYDPATFQYTSTGLNEGSGDMYTGAAGGTEPSLAGISIWGATFVAADGGVVQTSDGTEVGRIAF